MHRGHLITLVCPVGDEWVYYMWKGTRNVFELWRLELQGWNYEMGSERQDFGSEREYSSAART